MDSIAPNQLESFPLHEASQFKLGELQGIIIILPKLFRMKTVYEITALCPENLAANQSILEYRSRIATLRQQKKFGAGKI